MLFLYRSMISIEERKIKGRHYYWVLDCKYDSKIGFKADRKIQNYATFW